MRSPESAKWCANERCWFDSNTLLEFLDAQQTTIRGWWWESRPGEFHPEALAEPDVTLSHHPAPIREPPRIDIQCANRCGARRETAATHCRARREVPLNWMPSESGPSCVVAKWEVGQVSGRCPECGFLDRNRKLISRSNSSGWFNSLLLG